MRRAVVTLVGVLASPASAQQLSDKWVAPADAVTRPNPVPATPEAVKRGRAVYQQHCATCHGEKGKGDGPYARLHARRSLPPRDLTLPEVQSRLSDGEIFWKISQGLRQVGRIIMPSFETDIRSADDRWKLVLYVRTLGKVTE